ncbi:MAG: winged helix DNA-binding domain-containing protein [Chloroflexi bacterium]|nr:winged helix DNA-binding domain-containing protein [Chloroflexota bacterium]
MSPRPDPLAVGGTKRAFRRRIGDDERLARLAIRHRLAVGTQALTLADAAASVVALHATDPVSVFLQARARMLESSPAAIERALYEDRTVLRMMAMRRTLFLVPLGDVAIVQAAASRAIAALERKRTIKMFADGGIGPDPIALLEGLETIGLAALRARGEAATAELTAVDPRLGQTFVLAAGKAYEGTMSVSSKVFFHLALDGHSARGRPLGTWIGGQYRWSPIERWLPDRIPDLPVDVARAALVRRWLAAFGPGTRDDIKWWTGWTVADVRTALATIGAVEVELDNGAIGYVLADDLEPVGATAPWVALLPALDATTMGWQARDWYLGQHRAALFDRNGNAGPTIWAAGRIVGGWAQRRTGEIVTRLLADVGTEMSRAIETEAARLQAWIDPTRIGSRFPTPLETQLRT